MPGDLIGGLQWFGKLPIFDAQQIPVFDSVYMSGKLRTRCEQTNYFSELVNQRLKWYHTTVTGESVAVHVRATKRLLGEITDTRV